jgi:phage terminase large subunit-like protein
MASTTAPALDYSALSEHDRGELLRAQGLIDAQTSFRAYVTWVCGWRIRPHQEAWIDALQDLYDGTLTTADGEPTNKLMILSFPSSGKSRTVCQFAQWVIGREISKGRDPTIGYVCYADRLAARNSLTVRKPFDEEWETYRHVFPDVARSKTAAWQNNEWSLKKRAGGDDSTFLAAGRSTSTLGYRFDSLIVMDDMLDRFAATSDAEKERAWGIYNDEIATRGNYETPQLHISTRFAEDDVPGRLMEQGGAVGWTVLHTPCLIEEEKGDETVYRSAWPPEVTVEDKQPRGKSVRDLLWERDHNPASFLSQWQALPPSELGDVFSIIDFVDKPKPEDVSAVWACWDSAEGEKDHHAYSACVEAVKLKTGRFVIVNTHRHKLAEDKLLAVIAEQKERLYNTWGVMPRGLVEKKSNGASLALWTWLRAVTIKNHDMINRAKMSAAPCFFEGRLLVSRDYWADQSAYLTELRGFPATHYKDWVSATCLLAENVVLSRWAKLDDIKPAMEISGYGFVRGIA